MTAEAILVTGLSGLIGGAVARRLADAGKTVVGMDRVAPVNAYFPVIVHDLPDPQRWHEAIVRYGVRKVVHAGGISGPMLLQDAPARLCDINIGGLLGLLEAARIHRLERIVWFSSNSRLWRPGRPVPRHRRYIAPPKHDLRGDQGGRRGLDRGISRRARRRRRLTACRVLLWARSHDRVLDANVG